MTEHAKIVPVGDATAVILPTDLLDRLRNGSGDTVRFVEEADGSVRLMREDPEFERQMAAVRKIMKKDWHVLRALAK